MRAENSRRASVSRGESGLTFHRQPPIRFMIPRRRLRGQKEGIRAQRLEPRPQRGPRTSAPDLRRQRTRIGCRSPLESSPVVETLWRACREGQFTQPVQVRPQDVSVHLGSDLGGGEGDRAVEAPGASVRSGGSASVRAVTRVKPEQASKGLMRAPSPFSMDEGRCGRPDTPTQEGRPARRGSGHSTYARGDWQHGRPVALAGSTANGPAEGRARQASEGLILPLKPSNAGGGKGPWFGVRPVLQRLRFPEMPSTRSDPRLRSGLQRSKSIPRAPPAHGPWEIPRGQPESLRQPARRQRHRGRRPRLTPGVG